MQETFTSTIKQIVVDKTYIRFWFEEPSTRVRITRNTIDVSADDNIHKGELPDYVCFIEDLPNIENNVSNSIVNHGYQGKRVVFAKPSNLAFGTFKIVQILDKISDKEIVYQYLEVRNDLAKRNGKRYFKLNCNDYISPVLQVCISQGDVKKGRGHHIGIYEISNTTFRSNYLSTNYTIPSTKEQFDKKFEEVILKLKSK